jgi:type VI secretion system protein ImpH
VTGAGEAAPGASAANADAVATPASGRSPALAEALADLQARPKTWDFFAAVRAARAAFPGVPGIGRSVRMQDEPIEFLQRPTLAFIASPVVSARFKPGADREDAVGPGFEIEQVFFGALGSNGPLPAHVTADAVAEARDGRPWLKRFLDLFNNRMTQFFYRAWEAGQPAVSRELEGDDPWPRWIGAVYGGAPDALRDRDALPDDLRRFASGWFGAGRRSTAALEGVAGIVIGRRVTAEQFIPEWLPMPPDEQARLGVANCALGVDAAVGPRFYSMTTRVRLRTEPLDYRTFASLFPDAPRFAAARDALRSLMGLAWGWELNPVLREAEIPPLGLDGARRLGWDSWMPAPPGRGDADDPILRGDPPLSPGARL